MNFNENSHKLRGHFSIESLDKDGNVIDSWSSKNIITNTARIEFAKIIAGVEQAGAINRFVMGTKGHVGDDVLTPKGEDEGFTASVTDIFSGQEAAELNKTWSQLSFTPSGSMTSTTALDVLDGANNNSTVDISILGVVENMPVVQYTFNIAQDAFNCENNGVIYTECGLYKDEKLIAMRTFKGKVKEDTVSFRIIWSIYM